MKKFVIAIGELAKAMTGYFNPSAYEARVLRGLVGTGDKMAEYAEKYLSKVKGGNKKHRKYLRHYIRKWNADRSRLR